ncbi:MAG: toprim domain-containing protein [archaeon]
MYIGSTSQKGVTHLIWEVADNSFDEYVAGFGEEISIHIAKDSTVTIEDHGRGIPVGPHHKWKNKDGSPMNTLTGVLTKLHAGGKFNKEGSGYKVSGGLHGIGGKAVNALSDKFTAIVKRDGKKYKQEFSKGEPISEVEIIGKVDKNDTGTIITYHPDPEIFKITLEPNCKDIQSRLKELASLNGGVKVIYKNEITGIDEIYHFEDGIKGYVKRMVEDRKTLYDEPFYIKGNYEINKDKIIIVEVAFLHDDEEKASENIKSFANNINTYEGGFHWQGFRNEMKRQLNGFGENNKIINDPIELKYLLDGIHAVVSVKVPEAEFEGQTKTKLGNTEAQDAVEEIMKKGFKDIIKERKNKNILEAVLIRASQVKEAEIAARAARKAARKAKKATSMALPGKLADCSNRSGYSELFLVEGDSAAGCFTYDTKIKLADGRNLEIGKIVEEFNQGKKNYVYSSNKDGMIYIQPIVDAFKTKTVDKIIKLTLDNGKEIKCTLDHKFMLKDGTFKEAQNLSKEDSLMPLYTKYSESSIKIWNDNKQIDETNAYKFIKLNINDQWVATHHLCSTQYLGFKPKYFHTHHKDTDRRNNNPDNLEYKNGKKHLSEHQKEWFMDENNKKEFSKKMKELWKDPEFKKLKQEQAREQMLYGKGLLSAHRKKLKNDPEYFERNWKKLHSPESAKKRRKSLRKYYKNNQDAKEYLSKIAKEQWDDKELREWRAQKTSEQMNQPGYIEKHKKKIYNKKKEHAIKVIEKLKKKGLEINKQNYNNARTEKKEPRWRTLIKYFDNEENILNWVNNYNHKIIKKEIIEETQDVFDITVPPHNNFALSAGVFVHNSAKQGRYREFQAILPLRGKVKNTEKSTFDKMMKSPAIKNIIAALGAGIGKTFDIDRVRYDKVIVMTDADDDGSHIKALLLTLFYNYMPDLINEGKVFLTMPPLYRIVHGKNSYYLKDDHDLRDYRRKNKGKNFEVQRFKGLGEMNFDQLKITTMDPKTRILKQVTMEDAERANEAFDVWMGKNAKLRREFIEANADSVSLEFA